MRESIFIKNSTPLLFTIKRVTLPLPAQWRRANLCAFLREIRITLGDKTGLDQVIINYRNIL